MLNLIQRTYSNRFRKSLGSRKSDLEAEKATDKGKVTLTVESYVTTSFDLEKVLPPPRHSSKLECRIAKAQKESVL